MRGRSTLRLGALALVTGFLAALPAHGQTALWIGGGTDESYTNPTNWQGGIVPDSSGGYTVQLSYTNDTIMVNTAANILGISYLGSSGFNGTQFQGSGSIKIGGDGISPGGGAGSTVSFNVPVILTASQTWTAASGGDYGFIASYTGIGQTGGPQTLTIGDGQVYMTGTNTFSGGVIVSPTGVLYAGTDSAAGLASGTLTLQDGSTLKAWSSGATIANPIALGNNVTLGATGTGEVFDLSGVVTAVNSATTVQIYNTSSVTISGTLTGPPGTDYDIVGLGGSVQVNDGGSQLIFSGAVSQVNSITADGSQVILAPVTMNPLTSYPGISSSGFLVSNQGYLGLDGTFTTPGAVANFFTTYSAGMAETISGSIGFDNVLNPGIPNTFNDPIDLSNFAEDSGFLGIGSATQAILTGNITPTTSGNAYIFGGGGGTLTVTSDLENYGGMYGMTRLYMTDAPAPLTLILQGANNYTGGVVSDGGVLIFDSTVLPGIGSIQLNGGYVGYTEVPMLSSAAFIALFSTFPNGGIIGFDQHTPNPGSPRLIGDTIDLSGFDSYTTLFIGTATAAEFTTLATITPANNNYGFTGVKGGLLTVDTVLADGMVPYSVTIGLQTPIESNQSISSVTLTGTNTYTGGTTINSGQLFINNDAALGNASGVVNVPDANQSLATAPVLASFGGSPVTVANAIAVGSLGGGSTQGLTLGNAFPQGGDMLVLNGVISDYPSTTGMVAITGPVTLGGVNTYSGGTIITGDGNAVALVTNSMSFGTGSINVQDDGDIAPMGADVALSNPIDLDGSPLTLGVSGNAFVLTLNGVISGNGNLTIDSSVTLNAANNYIGPTIINDANVVIGSEGSFGVGSVSLTDSTLTYGYSPTILDLSGPDSNSAVALAPGQTLTLDADASGGSFNGGIMGDGTNNVIKIDTGIEQLNGNSTYGGGTDVTAGTLIAGSPTALGTGPVTVESGAQLGVNNGAVLALPITLSGNSTLSGNGTFAPVATVDFSAGNTVMPGIPIYGQYVSTLTFSNNVTFGNGGIYSLNISNAGGVAGIDYSTLNIGGTLAITTAVPGSFTLALNSIAPGGGPGMAIFNSALPYSMTILTSASPITGFSPSIFAFNTTAFQNSLGGGSFQVGNVGDTLTLNFTPAPEPSTWALLVTGLATAGMGFRRRRRH